MEVVDEVAVHGDQVVPAELEGLGVVVVELVGAGQALVVDGMDSAHRGLVQGDTGVSVVAVRSAVAAALIGLSFCVRRTWAGGTYSAINKQELESP